MGGGECLEGGGASDVQPRPFAAQQSCAWPQPAALSAATQLIFANKSERLVYKRGAPRLNWGIIKTNNLEKINHILFWGFII